MFFLAMYSVIIVEAYFAKSWYCLMFSMLYGNAGVIL